NNAKEIVSKLKKLDFDIDLLSDYDIYHKESNIVILGYTAINTNNIKNGLEIINKIINENSN
ncbi:MAG: hypothetical protein K6E20_04035, partial [Acholeplasmatales bacterium]|nr:hypothetical protein [Acholeplasmatales bacterium]